MSKIVLKTAKGEFSYWDDISVNLNLASRASTFSFTGWMNAESMFLFKPFSYEECEVWIVNEELNINEQLITGFITNPGVGKNSKPSLQTISGFSRPGILDSVCYPPSMYPLQFKNKTLKQLATDICDKFDLTLKIHDGAIGACNSPYTNIKCEETDTIGSFLDRIGRLKGVTVAHDNLGNLFLYRILDVINASSIITMDSYVFDVNYAPNSQGMHSECTAIMEMDINSNTLTDEKDTKPIVESDNLMMKTVKSTFITNKFLPTTIKVPNPEKKPKRKSKKTKEKYDYEDFTLEEWAEKELAAEARNFPITVKKIGWDFDGRIVRAGFYLDMEYPDLNIERTKFLVESQSFTKKGKEVEVQTIEILLPCVYTGKLPKKSPFNF